MVLEGIKIYIAFSNKPGKGINGRNINTEHEHDFHMAEHYQNVEQSDSNQERPDHL